MLMSTKKTMTRQEWNRAAAEAARTRGQYALVMDNWKALDRSKTPRVAVGGLLRALSAKNTHTEPAKGVLVTQPGVLVEWHPVNAARAAAGTCGSCDRCVTGTVGPGTSDCYKPKHMRLTSV